MRCATFSHSFVLAVMADNDTELPFRAGYAYNNKPKNCRRCKMKISLGELRLAKMVESCVTDKFKVPKWYHVACFFKSPEQPKNVQDIFLFETLRLAEQDFIRGKIDHSSDYSVCGYFANGVGKRTATTLTSGTKATPNYDKFEIEYSKNNRYRCDGCKKKIMHDELRVSKFNYTSNGVHHLDDNPPMYHLDCFARARQELKFWRSGARLPGIGALEVEDQIKVRRALPEIDQRLDEETGGNSPTIPQLRIEDNNEVKRRYSRKTFECHRSPNFINTTNSNRGEEPNEAEMVSSAYVVEDSKTEEEIHSQADEGDSDPASSSTAYSVPSNEAEVTTGLSGEFEYSKTSRATCKGCQKKIMRSEIRISKMQPNKSWYHLHCYAKTTQVPQLGSSDDQLPSVEALSERDRMKVKNILQEIKMSDQELQTKRPEILETEDNEYDDNDVYAFRDQPVTPYQSLDSLRTFENRLSSNFLIGESKSAIDKNSRGEEPSEAEMNVLDDASSLCLDEPVQNLIHLLFDRNLMENALEEMEIDSKAMPLDKLSRERIEKGFVVLKQLHDEVASRDGAKINKKTVRRCTNEFYSLIPSKFEANEPPPLSDLRTIQQKARMLNSLMGIEIAYSMSLSSLDESNDRDNDEGCESDARVYYEKLNVNIRTMEETEPEFEMLKLCVQNANAPTHPDRKLEIIQIFEVERRGESERYTQFRKWDNRYLLWYGSRLTNFAGILSQGLRIAPAEAASSGYSFGNGIYFADLVSKAAKQCEARASKDVGLLLVCEVALGNIQVLSKDEPQLVKPGSGFNSVKGRGRTIPHICRTKMLRNGVQIEEGSEVRFLCSASLTSSLSYNEYVVYDEAQVKMRYLIQTKFHFVQGGSEESNSFNS